MRGTLRRLALLAGAVLPTLLGWLLAPLPPLRTGESLLGALPATAAPLAVEVRGAGPELRALQREGVWEPLVQGLEDGTLKETLLRLGHDPLARWALTRGAGEAAVGMAVSPPRPRLGMLRLSNLAHCLAGAALWWWGEEGVRRRLALPGRRLRLRLAGRTLVVGPDAETCQAVADGLRSGPPASPLPAAWQLPARAVAARLENPQGGAVSGADGQGGLPLWRRLHGGALLLTRSADHLTARVAARTAAPAALGDAGPRRRRPRRPATFPGPADEAVARVWGWADAARLWKALNAAVWPEHGGPGAGTDPPLLVALWDAVDRGLVPHADGRFALRVDPSPPPPPTLSPVPEVHAALGTPVPAAALRAWQEQLGRVVELFRAPGGADLWEGVRRETRLVERRPGGGARALRLELHRLFWHGAEPYWLIRPAEKALYGGSHAPARLVEVGDAEAGAGAGRSPAALPPFRAAEEELLLTLAAAWRLPPQEVEKWNRLLLDKTDHYQWIPRRYLPGMRRLTGGLRLAGQGIRRGQTRLTARLLPPAEESAGGATLHIDTRLDLWLNTGVLKRAAAAAAPAAETSTAEVAERQTR